MPAVLHDEPANDFSSLPFYMRYRWIFVLFILCPLNMLFEFAMWAAAKLRRVSPELHDQRVRRVQDELRRAVAAKQRICTDRPGWMAMALRLNLYKASLRPIKMRDFVDILSLDARQLVMRVEPFVTMAQVTERLAPLGLTLPVVPELDDLTVGGLVMGVGIESSSHAHGLFNDNCIAYEVIVADGSLVRATADNEHSELFHALPWSYGTLGILVAAELRVQAAAPYVRLEYRCARTEEQVVDMFQAAHGPSASSADEGRVPDFVEGLAYSPTHAVIMTGMMAHTVPAGATLNRIGRWHAPWFFEHARDMFFKTAASEFVVEYVPLRDYYHRHTRSVFWQMRELLPFGNHPLFRLLLGWVLPVKISMLKLSTPEAIGKVYEKKFVFQDMLVPAKSLRDSLRCFRDELGQYPLWLCGYRQRRTQPQGFLRPSTGGPDNELFVDIGAYGMPPAAAGAGFDVRATVRRLEAFVAKHEGYQMLYADTYMTEDEFRRMFDHTLHDRMRIKYGAAAVFPSIFSKVRKC
jgi:delta24-sterol reductase